MNEEIEKIIKERFEKCETVGETAVLYTEILKVIEDCYKAKAKAIIATE
jgi:hypothetical protein